MESGSKELKRIDEILKEYIANEIPMLKDQLELDHGGNECNAKDATTKMFVVK